MNRHGPGGSIRCVGGVVRDDRGRLLLIRRAHPPGEGRWSLPGGRAEQKESDEQAVVREVREETGLTVRVGPLVGRTEIPAPASAVFDIHDYAATVSGGTLAAGDDADDARWVTYEEMAALPLVEGLLDTLSAWGVLPRSAGDG